MVIRHKYSPLILIGTIPRPYVITIFSMTPSHFSCYTAFNSSFTEKQHRNLKLTNCISEKMVANTAPCYNESIKKKEVIHYDIRRKTLQTT